MLEQERDFRDMFEGKDLPEWKLDWLEEIIDHWGELDIRDQTTKKIIGLIVDGTLESLPSYYDFYSSDGYTEEDLDKQENEDGPTEDISIPSYDTYLEYHIKDMKFVDTINNSKKELS